MKITDINFKELFRNVEDSAWYGKGNSKRYITDGNNLLFIKGYTYEPCYEYFSATHEIVLNGEILFGINSQNVEAYHNEEYTFGKLKSDEESINYIKNIFGEKEISISNDDPTENKEQDEEDEEDEL